MNPFFTGWSARSALPLLGFLFATLLTIAVGLGALAFGLSASADDPGGGDFTGDKDLAGIMIADPYPMIVTDAGHTVMLSGGGKRGVQEQARPLDGQRVRVTGAGVKRGDRDLLLVDRLEPSSGAASPPVRQPLGLWRLTGEICDGKCALGVMRQGNKPAHKACANVCLTGGVPPVFITTTPVLGTRYLLMGDPDNHALPDAFRDHTGVTRRMDGVLERVGDAMIFRTDVRYAQTP